ncbi:MAG: succinylglutamate desuccinylase/aspartoacylase family protein [Bdellovibrionales bacterium]|nr:succinylglutamate desuccinylase/aspartoacylase family protein [Bdellovibrionales bacterium]
MKTFIFGKTVQKVPIMAYHFNGSGPKTLILGGVHGNEWEGIVCAKALLSSFIEDMPLNLDLTIVPILNVDGAIRNQRKNFNQVDLNRNLPTKDWTKDVAEEKYFPGPAANSEPENQALVKWVEAHKPKLVISLHSWNPMLNVNGDCNPEAEVINKLTGYEIKESIGYPTPGCLGTYTGLEQNMPTITYELERNIEFEKIHDIHVPAIMAALKQTQTHR